MKAMITRFHAFLGIGLLLGSCDKPAPVTNPPPEQTAAPRVTKSVRTPDEGPPASRSSLRESLENALNLPTPEERDQALSAVIWDALEENPELAQEAFRKLGEGSEEKIALIKHFGMRLAEQDLDTATAWAKSLATPDEQSLAFGKIALVLSATDPEAAAKLLSDSGVASRDFDVAVVEVIQRWAAQTPDNAAAWVIQFDPGEIRAAGLKAVISTWVDQDVNATLAWINNLQNPSVKEEAITGMAETILEFPEARRIELLGLASPDIRARFEALKAEAGS
jgi:hypothetical protein